MQRIESIQRPAFVTLLVILALFWASCSVAQSGKFGGVGLQVVPTVKGDLVVLNVLDGSPARAAGFQPGDLIVRVDDHSLKGSDFAEVVKRYLWGPEGTTVTLKFLRPGVSGSRSVKLTRVVLKKGSAKTPGVRMIKPGK